MHHWLGQASLHPLHPRYIMRFLYMNLNSWGEHHAKDHRK
jgi:hypothetical protein